METNGPDGASLARALLGALCAIALGGCGGGGGGSTGVITDAADPAVPVPSVPAEPLGPAPDDVGGTVLLEERRGKTTIEAWFAPPAPATVPAAPDWQRDGDRCTLLAGDPLVPPAAGAAPAAPVTFEAGEALTLSSRGGEHARLGLQRLGDARTYATSARWLDAPLPDDLVLTIPGGTGFAASGSVPIAPVAAPALVAPPDAVLAAATDEVRWETSPADDDRLRLTLSVADVAGGNVALAVVDCELEDDGAFTLPGELVERLPSAHGGIVLALARERTTRHVLDGRAVSVRSIAMP